MNMILQEFLEKAARGENVYISDVRRAFSEADCSILCDLTLPVGGGKRWEIRIPAVTEQVEREFVSEYFYATLYNILSTFGGSRMTLCRQPGDNFSKQLCETLDHVFQVDIPKSKRRGYGKCLNVTDRINAAMGKAPFSFRITEETLDALPAEAEQHSDAVLACRSAVQKANNATICGIDIGGTDIKVVGIQGGKIVAVKEYDWFPAEMTRMEQLIEPILLMARVVRAAMSLPSTPEAAMLREQMLKKGISDEAMQSAVDTCRAVYGEAPLLDGIGVCFPDVVIDDQILGGETYKTRGIRNASEDYEKEFALLGSLKTLLLKQCKPHGKVHLSNDGSLAAYTAAVEMAHSAEADSVKCGVFAHTLGTELGTGWIDETGEIPQIPLEVYNCIIDLGNRPVRAYHELDARSVNNFNTGLSGTLQKYCSQSGAYRLALRIFEKKAPARYADLFDQGFLEHRSNGVFVRQSPSDMRKPLLEHLMRLAAEGDAASEEIFREIGEFLAVTFEETEWMLSPRSRARILFGRFVKHKRCFELMQQGANTRNDVRFIAGDGTLAFTPVMLELKSDPVHTVAQFGQAVGAAYFAASQL
ncbi:MAG: hypothetical protein C0413_03050 [Clostridiales bacterium]|nr:hypothetical protein [Clostridiales bacterium]